MCAVCVAAITTGIGAGTTAIGQLGETKLKRFFTPRNIYIIILVILGLFAILPIAAPILRKIGLTSISDIIYNSYFIFCHQRASHSFHIFDYQLAYCARDTFIWSTVFLISLIRFYFPFKTIRWYWFLILCIPMALDGGTQFISLFLNVIGKGEIFYESTNLSRAITGSLFGIAVGGSLVAYLIDTINPAMEKTTSVKKGVFLTLVASFLLFIGIYILQITTSPSYPPAGIFDSKPRNYGYNFVNEPKLLHK